MLSSKDSLNIGASYLGKANFNNGFSSFSRLGTLSGKTLAMYIKSLFANNEIGFAYDPNDLTTLYQDAAGTIPTALTMQPVAYIKDLSGSGNHAKQVDSSKRPLLNSIPYFLDYDGTDDELVVDIANQLTNCTVITATRNNPFSVQTGVTIPAGGYKVKPERTMLVINRDLTPLELYTLEMEFKKHLTDSVRRQSDGLQTVLYTAKGQPTYMNIIQKFDLSSIDASLSGTHPAFIVDGVEKPEIFVGTYQGVIRDGELLSLPNVEPSHSTNYTNFLAYARANGNGHHLITNAEWSAVALQCYKNNTQPSGNTYYGRSAEDPLLFGRRADGLAPGNAAGLARTLTGSGPAQWRHNGKTNGIADLSGNVWEWNSGMRLLKGEIQIVADNNAAKLAIDLGATSAEWKAIDGATGNLVTPDGSGTTVGTVKFAASGTADYTLVISGGGGAFDAMTNPSTTKPVSAAALNKLKALGLFPLVSGSANFGADGFWHNLTIESTPLRGAGWNHGATAGVFALYLGSVRTHSDASVGARPAFVNL